MSKVIMFYPKLEPHKDYHYMPISLLAAAANMNTDDMILIDERVQSDWQDKIQDNINNCEYFMISAFTGYQLSRCYAVAKWIKETYPNIKIVVGGPHVTALPEQTLDSPYIDAVIQGDTDNGQNPLPFYLIDIEKYVNPETKRFIAITSYSCPGVCTFCATKNHRKYFPLPIERVKADIDNLMSKYPFKEAVFFDATLFAMPERVKQIAEIMNHYNLEWIADARAPEIAKLDYWDMYEFVSKGLKQLTIGLESGGQRIVENMRKGKNHLQDFKKAAELMAKFPIKMVSGIVFGTPGETIEDLQLTIDYIKEIKAINPNFYISTTFYKPLPDTVMADMCKPYGYKEPDSLQAWAVYGEKGHYHYNHFEDVPWIIGIEEYKKIYDRFVTENSDLFI